MTKWLDLLRSKWAKFVGAAVAAAGVIAYVGNATSGLANSIPFLTTIYNKYIDKKHFSFSFSVDSARIFKVDKPFKPNEPGFNNQISMTVEFHFDQSDKIEIKTIQVDTGSKLEMGDALLNNPYQNGSVAKIRISKISNLPKIIDDNFKSQKNLNYSNLVELLEKNYLDIYGNTKGFGPGWFMFCSEKSNENESAWSNFYYRLVYLTVLFDGAPDQYCILGSFPVVGATIYESKDPRFVKPTRIP